MQKCGTGISMAIYPVLSANEGS